MSLIDGRIGNRRVHRLEIRLTADEGNRLEQLANSYNIDKSQFVRERLFGRATDYIKSEINNAIERVRDGYKKAKTTLKNNLLYHENIYRLGYNQFDYESQSYR